MSARRDIARLIRDLRQGGVDVEERKTRWVIRAPAGPVFVGKRHNDTRALANIRAQLRRSGL